MAHVEIIHEVLDGDQDEWRLCFQWVRYVYDHDLSETGYRFIWRRPNDHLQAARGQARIPDSATLFRLLSLAAEAGWFCTAENERPEGV
jgi:hypothetical protein